MSYATLQRIWRIRHISHTVKIFSQLTDILLALVSGFFSLCLAVGPSDDMVAHTVPFICLIIILPLVYIAHCLQSEDQSVAVVVYTLVSGVKASLDIIALTERHIDGRYAQFMDFLWVALAVPAPLLSPPPHVEGTARESRIAKREAFNAAAVTMPLLLFFIPAVFGNIVISIFVGLLKRIHSIFVPQNPNSHLAATITRRVEVIPTTQCIRPITLASVFIGDIIGFFNYAFNHSMFIAFEKYGPIFALNNGQAVVACLDIASAERLLSKDVLTCKGSEPTVQYLEPKYALNFERKGPLARQIRDLHLHLVP